ncbi:hypothetical protein GUITHDRAFT_152033 [Guillardia theta CCMP2712]|uniref:Uncharacterized protein n=1 Tax=Guillardia theta (strain CCMP2712) TaxID=905079 RepID=L1JGE9_GUITC|nr:hypothetical protein GUITHDRAFT_152033 [Guillardia theta CCMP2712]EKX47598.1 hypothetical protein GUITHDRAFT_152033 [Guillardia theta CCMP2712]|mmetsp:Transcript_6632/g.23422  ORF Transcript_6632/g.23422 Transcript_6632/m.23422 type:complete len:156 (+) Transcript_6632:221-688(+)|eukprot:XP_005834578.1 hypothetical protein GUITHDRAFT_152033 [Guillardia theta CCMP2712]
MKQSCDTNLLSPCSSHKLCVAELFFFEELSRTCGVDVASSWLKSVSISPTRSQTSSVEPGSSPVSPRQRPSSVELQKAAKGTRNKKGLSLNCVPTAISLPTTPKSFFDSMEPTDCLLQAILKKKEMQKFQTKLGSKAGLLYTSEANLVLDDAIEC